VKPEAKRRFGRRKLGIKKWIWEGSTELVCIGIRVTDSLLNTLMNLQVP
jgi:hypothetical protein